MHLFQREVKQEKSSFNLNKKSLVLRKEINLITFEILFHMHNFLSTSFQVIIVLSVDFLKRDS